MAEMSESAQKYLTELNKTRTRVEKATGVKMSDAAWKASQTSYAKALDKAKREKAAKADKPAPPKPPSDTSSKSSSNRGGRVGSPSAGGSMRPSTTKRSSGLGGVASTVAAAAGGLAAGKVVTSVANRGSRVGSPSNAARGSRPSSSGQAGRAGENYGRQIRTGAGGSGQYGRPSPSGRKVGRGTQAGSPSKKGRTVAGQTNPMKGRGGTSGKPKGN